jgi:ribosomal protein L37E
MNATATHTHCLRCGRHLTNAHSTATGYGPTCARKIRTANVDTADYKAHQVDSARELITDGAIIPLRSVVFLTVSTDGTETYRSAPTGCTCPAGLKGGRCYHQLAARMLLAA